MEKSVAAIIPAAGSGRRLGFGMPKAWVELCGKPMISHTLKPFLRDEKVGQIVVAVPPEMEEAFEILKRDYPFRKKIKIVRGGRERQDSVLNAFLFLDADRFDIVLIHDAARPLVSNLTISDVIDKARAFGAAVAVVPVADTLKCSSPDLATLKTVDRSGFYHAQTPQGFQYLILKKALEAAVLDGFYGTDTASLVERIGLPVRAAAGEEMNFKITTREDLAVAEILLKS